VNTAKFHCLTLPDFSDCQRPSVSGRHFLPFRVSAEKTTPCHCKFSAVVSRLVFSAVPFLTFCSAYEVIHAILGHSNHYCHLRSYNAAKQQACFKSNKQIDKEYTHKKPIQSLVQCIPYTARLAPSSPVPTSAPVRCRSRRSIASPSSDELSQSRLSGWNCNHEEAAADNKINTFSLLPHMYFLPSKPQTGEAIIHFGSRTTWI